MPGQGVKDRAVYRTLIGILCTLSSPSLLPGRAEVMASQTYLLRPERKAGDLVQVEVVLQAGGDLHLHNSNAVAGTPASIRTLPMTVAAKLVYDERTLGLRNDDKGSCRSVRYYQSAKALIEFEKTVQNLSLGEKQKLIAVDTTEAETTLVSLGKRISREERDLVDGVGSSLILDEFLPREPVPLGGVWKHSDNLLAALLRLDAVSLGDVQSMLAEVHPQENAAKISMAGTVHGAVGGVATEIELKSKYTFDLSSKRITAFALLVKEKRSIGHVGPGLDMVAKQIVKIRPLGVSDQLPDSVVPDAQRALDESARLLLFESPHNRFRLDHDRRWFVTSDEKKLTVFRLVDRGELVAQCNVAALDPVPDGQAFGLADFQRDIEKSLGKKFSQFVSAKEETDSSDRRIYRVVANGTVSDLSIQWLYYLYTTREGRRLSVAFTIEQGLVERFGRADQQFLAHLEIAPPQTATAGSPTPAQR